MNVRTIESAPSANDYLKALECEESSREFRPVAASKMQLTTGGLLQVGEEALEVVDEARGDLAKLARIPASYFAETFYDLHNAITFVGSHDADVLPQYRYRLRLGAGQLARGRAGVCRECRRLMIGAAASLN